MAKAIRTEAERKLQSVCAGLKATIKRLESSIKTQNHILDKQRANLNRLEAKPVPDTDQIKALKRTISQLEDELQKSEETLILLNKNFSENCSS